MAITLSPELSERVERAARDRGTDGESLAESLLSQILEIEEANLTTAVSSAYDELKAGGGVALEDFERDFDAHLAARRQALGNVPK